MKFLLNVIKILKFNKLDYVILAFLAFVLTSTLVLYIIEPQIKTVGDGLWYSFATFTTTGYGDITPVTTVGKVISVCLMLFGLVIIALFTGTLVNHYQRISEAHNKETIIHLMDKLEKLPELSKDELEVIANNIKNKRYR